MAVVYAANNQRLGILISAKAGEQAYVTLGDQVTSIPDGYLVSYEPTRVYYVNNDCTGQPLIEDSVYRQFASRVYVGYQNKLYYVASPSKANRAVGSYWTRTAGCAAAPSIGDTHLLTSVGVATNLDGTFPWRIVIE